MRGACVLAQADRQRVCTEHRACVGVMRGEARAGEGARVGSESACILKCATPVRYIPWSAGLGVPGLAVLEGRFGSAGLARGLLHEC